MSDLAFRDVGDGPPVVILHGLFGSARNWGAIAKGLAADHRVIAVDLPNHGVSPWRSGMDYLDLANTVRDFIVAHELDRPVVVGHSMGGIVAMTLALTDAEAIGALVVVDIAPVAYSRTLSGHAENMSQVPLGGLARRGDADAHLAGAVPDIGERAFLLQNLVSDGEGWRWRINLDAIRRDMDAITGFPEFAAETTYGGATLFMTGALSTYVGEEDRRTIEHLFPAAQFVEIADAGHWIHAQKPAAFLDQLT
jgi:esterase